MKKMLYLLLFTLLAALLAIQMNITNVRRELIAIRQLLDKPAEIVYQVDSAGASWHDKITDKEIKNNRYGVEVGSYGWFLVTKEQYEALNIGDDMPDNILNGGN